MGESGLSKVKCVVVGDGNVGKTCLLLRYTSNRFSEIYEVTLYDHYEKELELDGRRVLITVWDIAGQEDYENLRSLVYPSTNIVLLCFSLADKKTLDNILSKWMPEISQNCPDVPIILVGTKSDLKNDLGAFTTQEMKVTSNEAEAVRKKINKRYDLNCFLYLECSAKTQKGVDKVFLEAIRNGLNPPMKQRRKRKMKCAIL